MKIVNCIIIIPFVFGIVCFESGVSCNPTGEASDHSEVELIDVDLNNLNIDEVNTVTFKENPEAIIVNPKDKKRMKIIRIGDEIVWKQKEPTASLVSMGRNYVCLNFLLLVDKSGKIFIVLNVVHDNLKNFVNIVYDPSIGASGSVGAEAYNSRLRYMGLVPFVIELNKQFGGLKEQKKGLAQVDLNIEDVFDKWYYKYSATTFVAKNVSGKPVVKYETYEPNEGEIFLKVTDNYMDIWRSKELKRTGKMCKRLEVYSKYSNFMLLRLTLVDETHWHFKHNLLNGSWSPCREVEFGLTLKQLGYEVAFYMDQNGFERIRYPNSYAEAAGSQPSSAEAGTNTEDLLKDELNFWDINEQDFHFVRNRLSLLRIVTIVPKVKRMVYRINYNAKESKHIGSDDFAIDFIKWKNSFYFVETVKKHGGSYQCDYLDRSIGGYLWDHDDQCKFYHNMMNEFEFFDTDHAVTYRHFELLNRLNELAFVPSHLMLVM